MVPTDAEPPNTPSTIHVTFPAPAVNCWVRFGVKVDVLGAMERVPVPAVPVPAREMVCWPVPALSEIFTEAARAPVAVGVKVMLRVQCARDNRDGPQLLV